MKSEQTYEAKQVDMIVVGAGHAGCEAALSGARMGLKVMVLAINLDSIAFMACNPSIGGTAKGHLVREIDALGGEMGKAIDACFIQSRMLNVSKGPAVHSLRAQADKKMYHTYMKRVLEEEPNIILRQAEVTDILVEAQKVVGVRVKTGGIYRAKAVILTTGTYLRGKIFIGEVHYEAGPNDFMPARYLTQSLWQHGIQTRRFKTGTPARVHRESIDFSKLEIQYGDEAIVPFSFLNESLQKEQICCYLAYTNGKTHQVIMENLNRSPLYTGVIESVGPRYCPSIEDKVVRFHDKERHQIFVEPEGEDTQELYLQGMSSSLPAEVQEKLLKTIDGFSQIQIMRDAYAIEYDCIDATTLRPTLAHKQIGGLYFAGQINGSSGYEEAAAQGLMAGINAVCEIQGKAPFLLDRSEAYIGVLIDDLVWKETQEPYRMMTSRAEYRLMLRQDNADLRLTQKGYEVGLVDRARYDLFMKKKEDIQTLSVFLKENMIYPTKENNEWLCEKKASPLKKAISAYDFLKRPAHTMSLLQEILPIPYAFSPLVLEQVEIESKYEGYIEKQNKQIEAFRRLERKKLNPAIAYDAIQGLRLEARQKLNQMKPETIGQASRISGVSPADVNVLLVYLEQQKREEKK